MSGQEDSPNIPIRGSKKGRLQGACDICRRKKVRCDRAKMADKICSNCIAFNVPCTLTTSTHIPKKPTEEYVMALESRLKSAEDFLRQEHPDVEFNRKTAQYESKVQLSPGSRHSAATIADDILEHGEDSTHLHTWEAARRAALELAACTRILERSVARAASRPVSDYDPPNSAGAMTQTSLLRDFSDHFEVDEDDASFNGPPGLDRIDNALAEKFSQINVTDTSKRFFGKSSDVFLIHNLVKLKKAATGGLVGDGSMPKSISKRPEYWSIRPPGISEPASSAPQPVYNFPEADLLDHLIHEYFFHVNSLLPLLHYPTFIHGIQHGTHLRDRNFGGVVLMVCALGSLYSEDPRVLNGGIDPTLSRGWEWHDQVPADSTLQDTLSLHELQTCCLSVLFLNGASSGKASWIKIGVGIRFAQEVGAHRKKHNKITAEEEMWKRAFWILICIDRVISSFSGRPCATTEEDFDVDLPLEVDDEYWDHPNPELSWRQPPGKPSRITHFNSLIQLTKVLALASRTIYAVKRPKLHNNISLQEWNAHIVSELDAELAKWKETLPEHLVFKPERSDVLFFQQSVSANCSYYLVQMQVHRLFIPNPSQTSLPSLLICANGARKCAEILDAQRRRNLVALPYTQLAAFTSGVVLLTYILSSMALGRPVDYQHEMNNIKKHIDSLGACEKRWRTAGIFRDSVLGLVSVGVGGQAAFGTMPQTAPLQPSAEPGYLPPLHTMMSHVDNPHSPYAGSSNPQLVVHPNHSGVAGESAPYPPQNTLAMEGAYGHSNNTIYPHPHSTYAQPYYHSSTSNAPGLQEWWGAYFASVPSTFQQWTDHNPPP